MARTTFLAFAVLALVVRAIVPVGFMPGQASDGGQTLVVCPGHTESHHSTESHASTESKASSKQDDADSQDRDRCPYSGLALPSFVSLVSAPALEYAPAPVQAHGEAVAWYFIDRIADFVPSMPRAPPTLGVFLV